MMDRQKLLSFTSLFHAHVRTCRAKGPCKVCLAALRFFESLDRRDLSIALEDKSLLVHSSAWDTKERRRAQERRG